TFSARSGTALADSLVKGSIVLLASALLVDHLAHIHDAAINRGRSSHDRTHEQAARARPLAALEVAVAGAGNILARTGLVVIHGEAHAAPGPAPFKPGFAEDAVQPFGLGLGLDCLGAGHDHGLHIARHFAPAHDLGGFAQVFDAAVGARADKDNVDRLAFHRLPRLQA